MTTRSTTSASTQPSAWSGWAAFASILLVLLGAFNAIDGLTAIFSDQVFVATGSNSILVFDVTVWGWIHLLFGVAQIAVGVALTRGGFVARALAIGLVSLNALAQMAFLTAYPIWAALIIAVDMVTLWALIVHGDELKD